MTLPLLFSFAAHAAEPAYCRADTFLRHEVPDAERYLLYRDYIFQVGKVRLVGMAVGDSINYEIKDLAQQNLRTESAQHENNFCTWYFNHTEKDAERDYNWTPVDKPAQDTNPENIKRGVQKYMQALGGIFDSNQVNMLGCMEKYHYVAMGCDGMKHRGPTAFAMLLAFSGCSAEHSVQIVNTIWGLNGISYQGRLAVAQAAYDLGTKRPESRLRMQNLLK